MIYVITSIIPTFLISILRYVIPNLYVDNIRNFRSIAVSTMINRIEQQNNRIETNNSLLRIFTISLSSVKNKTQDL